MESMAKKHEEKKAEKKLPEEKKNKGKKEQRRQQTTGRVCILIIWKEDKRTRVGQKEERKGEKRRAFLLILFSHFLPSLLSLCAQFRGQWSTESIIIQAPARPIIHQIPSFFSTEKIISKIRIKKINIKNQNNQRTL